MGVYPMPSPSVHDARAPQPTDFSMSTTSKKNREMGPGRIYDMLLSARTADKVTLPFKDGRVVNGALIFNPYKGTGRVINIDQEVSVDFAVDDIRDLKM